MVFLIEEWGCQLDSNSKIEALLRIMADTPGEVEILDDVSSFLAKYNAKPGKNKVYVVMLNVLANIKRSEMIQGLTKNGFKIKYDFYGAYTRMNKRTANYFRDKYYTTIGTRRYEEAGPKKKKQ